MRRQVPFCRAAVLLAVVAAFLGLSGCFKVSEDVRVKADGSGAVSLHAEVDKKALAAVLERIGGAVGATLTPVRPVDRSFPDGTKVRVVDRPDRATLDASFDFRSPDEYSRKLQQVSEAVGDPGAPAPDQGSIQISRRGDRMEVALEVGSTVGGADDFDLSLLGGVADPAALPTFVVTITMPGSILATNGTTQGRTATWTITKDAPTTLTASSTVAAPGLPLWPPLLGAGLILLVLGVTVTFFVSQRRHAARPAVAADEPGSWPSSDRPGTETFFPPAPQPEGWPVPSSPAAPPPPSPAPPAWPGATRSSPPSPPAASPVPPSVGWSAPSPPPPAGPLPPSAGWSPMPTPRSTPPPAQPPEAPIATRAPLGPPAAPVSDASASPPSPAAAGEAGGDPLPWRVPGPPGQPASPDAPAQAPGPAAAPVPGWYADPAGGGGLRYWDGGRWTRHTA